MLKMTEHDFITCFLCHKLTTRRKYDTVPHWERVWLIKCSESLAQLLDLERIEPSFFENEFYCTGCTQLVRDVDFTVRISAKLETQTSRLRAQVTEFLVSGFQQISIQGPKIESEDLQIDQNIWENCPSPCESTPSSILFPELGAVSPNPVSSITKTASTGRKRLTGGVSPIPDLPPGGKLPLAKNSKKRKSKTDSKSVPLSSSSRSLANRTSYREESESDVDDRNKNESITSDEDFVPDIVPSLSPPTKRSKIIELRSKSRFFDNETQLQQNSNSSSVSITANGTKHIGKKFGPVTMNDIDDLSQEQLLTRMKSETGFYRRSHEDLEYLLRKFVQKWFPNGARIASQHHDHGKVTIIAEETSQDQDQLTIVTEEPFLSQNQDQATKMADETSRSQGQYEESLLVHLLRCEIEEYHNASKTYICDFPLCQGRFTDVDLLRRHKANEHKESMDPNPFECFYCRKRYPTGTLLDVHYRRLHENDEKPAHCEACTKEFLDIGHIVRHFKLRHKGLQSTLTGHPTFLSYRDKVAMCSSTYLNRPKQKCRDAKAPRDLYCPAQGCTYRSSSQQSLNFHNLEVHLKASHPFPCSKCRKSFKLRNSFHAHKCSYKDPFQCEHCGKTFAIRDKLYRHERRIHYETAKLKCSVCHRFYFNAEDVQAHEKLHTQATAYNCIISNCPEPRCDNLDELRTHATGAFHDRRKHELVCEQCGYVAKGFKAAELLNIHVRTHTGEEPLKCHFCEKRFKTNAVRKSHEEIHHPDLVQKRIYACKECDATFTVAQYLYKHNAWHKYGSNACRPVAKKR